MLTFIYNQDEAVLRFVSQFHGMPNMMWIDKCKTIGIIDEEGKLITGITYFNFDPTAEIIEMGLVSISRRWANRTVYKRMFEYPFIECGCQMLYTRVRADNEYLLGMMARLNFNLTLIPRMYGRDEDGVIGTLTDDQWLDNSMSRKLYRDVKPVEAAA